MPVFLLLHSLLIFLTRLTVFLLAFNSKPKLRALKFNYAFNTFFSSMTNELYFQHRYDISVKPDKPKKIAQKAFAVVKQQYFPKSVIAFDQRKNCYTLAPLWKGPDERVSYDVSISQYRDSVSHKMTLNVII